MRLFSVLIIYVLGMALMKGIPSLSIFTTGTLLVLGIDAAFTKWRKQ